MQLLLHLLVFFFYLKISKQKKINSEISLIKIFIITLSSSLCVYFDQKFIIVPAICFLKIVFGNYSKESKILSVLFYIFFSIPYVFLILIWGGDFTSQGYISYWKSILSTSFWIWFDDDSIYDFSIFNFSNRKNKIQL